MASTTIAVISLFCCLLKKSFDPDKEEQQTTQTQVERNRVEEKEDEVGKRNQGLTNHGLKDGRINAGVRSRSTCRSVCLNVSGDEKVVDTLDLGHCGGCRQLLLQELLVDQDGRVATWRKAKKKREKMRFVLWGRKERKAPLGEFEHGPCSLFLVSDMQGLLQLGNLLKERLNVLLRIGTLSDAGQGAAVVCECALAARTGPGPGAGAGAGVGAGVGVGGEWRCWSPFLEELEI